MLLKRSKQFVFTCQAFALVALVFSALCIATLLFKRIAATRKANPVNVTGTYHIATSCMLWSGMVCRYSL